MSIFPSRHERLAANDSVAVLGLGRFGRALCVELTETGTDVLGVDIDIEPVQALSNRITQAVQADTTKEDVLEDLSIAEFDRVVVAIGADVKASILTASLVLRLGVPVVWAKGDDQQHAMILEQLGVHKVLQPERDMGRRVAHLIRGQASDYVEIDPGYAMVKMATPKQLVANPKTARQYKVIVTAYQAADGTWVHTESSTVLHEGCQILVVGPTKGVEEFSKLK